MLTNTAVQPLPYTHADYEHFETIYNGFCYLIDHKSEQSSSFYSYTQAETIENLERFWTVLEMICRSLNIELELTLDDARHAIKGFDAKDAAELCNGGRYKRMQVQKVIAFEEDRLLDLTKTLLDKIMVRLRIFKKHSSSVLVPNMVPQADPDGDDYITFAAAAKMLSVHKTTVSRWLDSHKFTLGSFLVNPLVFACFLLLSN